MRHHASQLSEYNITSFTFFGNFSCDEGYVSETTDNTQALSSPLISPPRNIGGQRNLHSIRGMSIIWLGPLWHTLMDA